MQLKLIRLAIAALAFAIAPLSAKAADLPQPSYKAPAYVAPALFSWSGFYIGINGGYGFGTSNISNNVGSTGDFDIKGPVVGATLGYNLQTGSWVWGIEGDFDYSNIKGSSSAFCAPACTTSNSWLGTVRGRIGYAGWGNFMPYITGGGAFGPVKFEQGGVANTQTKFGWTIGAGLEYAFLGAWSAKLEYLYADLGTATCGAPTCNAGSDVKTTFKANLIRLGLNYRF